MKENKINRIYLIYRSILWINSLLILPLGGSVAIAQIHPLSDQYILNLYQTNPAVAGTERYAPLTLNTRQQWMGWRGAPSTQSVTVHTRLRAKSLFYTPRGFRNKGRNSFGKVGIGGGFFNYSYGSVGQAGLHLDYAYHLQLDRGRLAFGLAPSFFQYRLNKSGLIFPDPNTPDPVMNDSTEAVYFIDFNTGMHYYSENLYAGFSVIQLFNSTVKFGDFGFPREENPALNSDLTRSIYGYAGYKFTFNRDFILEPMLLAKYNQRNGFRIDLNATFNYRDLFLAGAGYRLKEGFVAFTGIRLDNLSFRYLFEIPLTSQVPAQFTSHIPSLTVR
jgi:type IX secretion system PorP/SprF family membrane protein